MTTKIERQPVQSSTVKSVGYDPDTKTMAVEFHGGQIYHYSDVKKDHYDELMAAKSVGSYLHKSIKGVYKHSKQD